MEINLYFRSSGSNTWKQFLHLWENSFTKVPQRVCWRSPREGAPERCFTKKLLRNNSQNQYGNVIDGTRNVCKEHLVNIKIKFGKFILSGTECLRPEILFSYCTPCYGTENQRKSAKVWWQKFVPVKRLLVYKKCVSLSINKVDNFTEYFSKNAKITEIITQKEKLFIAYFFTWIIRDFPLDSHTGYFKCRKTKKQKQTKVIRKRKYLADVWLMRMMYDWLIVWF